MQGLFIMALKNGEIFRDKRLLAQASIAAFSGFVRFIMYQRQ